MNLDGHQDRNHTDQSRTAHSCQNDKTVGAKHIKNIFIRYFHASLNFSSYDPPVKSLSTNVLAFRYSLNLSSTINPMEAHSMTAAKNSLPQSVAYKSVHNCKSIAVYRLSTNTSTIDQA